MIRQLLAASIMLAAATSPPAAAQTRPVAIEVPANAAFRHKHSGLTFPPVIDEVRRDRVSDGEPDQYDVAVNYALPDEATAITFYIFRDAAGSVPIWFDRARWSLEARDLNGDSERVPLPAPLTPPGGDVASGLIATYALEDSPFRSTGVAVLPVDGWYLKLRMSSKTLDAQALDAAMKRALAALQWPDTSSAAPAAAEIAPCPDALPFAAETSDLKNRQAALQTMIMSGITADLAFDKRPSAGTATRWCRDSAEVRLGAVYRADASRNAYLLALADSGRAVSVQPSLASRMFAAAGKSEQMPESWSVDLLGMRTAASFPPQDALPSPDRVLALLRSRPPVTTVLDQDKPQVNVDSSYAASAGKN